MGWSPEWQANTLALQFWNLRVRKLEGHKIKVKTLERVAKAAGLSDELDSDLAKALAQ